MLQPWHLFMLIYLLLSLSLYFLPSIIAYKKHKSNLTLIIICNLLLGWTVVGWIIVLILALKANALVTSDKGDNL